MTAHQQGVGAAFYCHACFAASREDSTPSAPPRSAQRRNGARHVGGGRVAQVAVVRPDDHARPLRVVPADVGDQVAHDGHEVLVSDVPCDLVPAAASFKPIQTLSKYRGCAWANTLT